MNSLTKETKLTLIYILVAFTFSVLMRMIWVYQFAGVEEFKYAGELMINTNDGYYWAEGARDILSGVSHINSTSPVSKAPAQLTAFLASILPFSFETIILYLPIYLSSLIVIPIILIAKDLKNLEMGLIASLLGSIAWSYYNRTMAGYYDTDMLNIVFPMFLLWSIIWAIDKQENRYLLITAISILVYRWWYPASYSLEFAFFGLILLYTLFLDRKNLYNYKLLAIMMFAMINIEEYFSLLLILITFYLFKQEKFQKYVYHIFGISIVLFLISGGINPIINRLSIYIFEDSVKSVQDGLQLHFYSVLQTVREAGSIPFETFANRISGSVITFILSIVGYVYLVYRHKIMILAIPLVGLGFLASVGGLRFTVYAVPILALGIAFLITEFSSKIKDKKLKYLIMTLLTLATLYPNYKHIEGYKVPTVFNTSEVAVLDVLKQRASREDYAIAWWDYGFPIRYYGDVKTLADGAQHSGAANFPVSYILTHPQKEASKMARLDVEYKEKNYNNHDKKQKIYSNIEEMTKDYGFKNTNDFLLSLQTDIKLPKKSRDIYFYLPFKMLNIYSTVRIFSHLNLMNGKREKSAFFYKTSRYKDTGAYLDFGSNIKLEKATNMIHVGKQKVAIKRYIKSAYNNKMQLLHDKQEFNVPNGLTILYLSSYRMFLILDEKTYNSLYIQLGIMEMYDKNLFEKVATNPHAKLYKLKI